MARAGKGNLSAQRQRRRDRLRGGFCGVDGEGITYPDGRHDYVLLTVGEETLHKDGGRLETGEILAFLYDQFEVNPLGRYVGFYLGYDFAQWLRDLPVDRAKKLLSAEGIAGRRRRLPHLPPFPVDWGEWQIDLLGMRRFRLRPRRRHWGTKREGFPWLTICDSGPFFQTSFLAAIDPQKWPDPILTAAEYELIRQGKAERGTAQFDAAMILYNRLECDVLARLMDTTDRGLLDQGIRLGRQQWFGPGQAAQKWLRAIDAPTGAAIRDAVPPPVREAARASYYGGWFEIFWHGPHAGPSWGYDINSAYPYVMASLPCLLHGAWTSGEGRNPWEGSTHPQLVYARVRGSNAVCGAMLHRTKKGNVLRPQTTEGWFWQFELDAAKAAGFIDMFHVKHWHCYRPCDCDPPLAPIAQLYEHRLAIGKNTPAGKAAKLVYNSSYGKFAQSVGDPAFGNPVYASLITARVRTMILEAIRTHPKGAGDLLMVATDSVTFASPHDNLRLDDAQLGAWTASRHDNQSFFMPGVYWDDAARGRLSAGTNVAATVKSRGIPAADLGNALLRIDRGWSRFARDGWPRFRLPIRFQLVSPRQALQRGKWELCGQVLTDRARLISADPILKRDAHGPGRSRPYREGWGEACSTPYDRLFGDDLAAAEEEFGDHPDGPVMTLLADQLYRD